MLERGNVEVGRRLFFKITIVLANGGWGGAIMLRRQIKMENKGLRCQRFMTMMMIKIIMRTKRRKGRVMIMIQTILKASPRSFLLQAVQTK